MHAELEEYNIKVSIPEPFRQKHLSRYFAFERHIKDVYIKARNAETGGKDQGLSGVEYNQIVTQTAINLGWCQSAETDAVELDPRAVTWVSNEVQREVLSYAILPKA